MSGNLAAAFDPRANALNTMRLVLAAMVILGHAAIVGGYPFSYATITLLGEVPVDGFFAISGFLMARSWYRSPLLGRELWHRFLRIFPAFWVALVMVAFVLAPIGVSIQGYGLGEYWSASAGPWDYLARNFTLWIGQEGIAGTPSGVPFPGQWDAPLWSLYWEFLAYLLLAVLGALGVIRQQRWVVPVLAAVLWVMTIWRSAIPGVREEYFSAFAADVIPRLFLMFLLGASLYLFAEKVPMHPLLAASSALLVAAGLFSGWEYRVIAALPMAYLVFWLGARLPLRVGMRTDISYGMYIYAFPIQQILVIAGWSAVGWWASAGLAVALTLPLAWLSWTVVERPALRFKNWTPGSGRQVDPEQPPAAQGDLAGVEVPRSEAEAVPGQVVMPEALPTGSASGPITVPRISGVWGDQVLAGNADSRPPAMAVGVALIAIGLFVAYAALMFTG